MGNMEARGIPDNSTDGEADNNLGVATNVAICLLCTVSSVAFELNVAVLLAYKSVSSCDNSCSQAFARSLCISDVMASLFGIVKTMLYFVEPAWVHCFLSESLLWCSMEGSTLTLTLMSVDLCLRHSRSARRSQGLDKMMVSFSLVFFWNGAFIVGFSPHMSSSAVTPPPGGFSCSMVHFYTPGYVIVFASSLLLCLAAACTLHVCVLRLQAAGEDHQPPQSSPPGVSRASACMLLLSRVILLLHLFLYTPAVLFLLLHCHICVLYQPEDASRRTDIILLFLLVVVVIKSPLSAMLQALKIPMLRLVLAKQYCWAWPCASGGTQVIQGRDPMTPATSVTFTEDTASTGLSEPTLSPRSVPSGDYRLPSDMFTVACKCCSRLNAVPRSCLGRTQLLHKATLWETRTPVVGVHVCGARPGQAAVSDRSLTATPCDDTKL